MGLRQLWADLRSDDDDLAARDLREASSRHGGRSVADAADRELITAAGTLRSVTLRPRATAPALTAELYDGSRTVCLVWLGRRRIRGIDPGAYLRATGRLCHPKGVPTIFNPAYEIVPGRD